MLDLFLAILVLITQQVICESCLCNYATGCGPSSPCCAGLTCNVFSGFTQCLEPSGYTTSTNGCILTASGYGCTSNANCCNPSAICSNKFCQLPCSTAASPSSSPSGLPIITPLASTRLPTTKPSTPSRAPSCNPTVKSSKPSFRPSSIASPSIIPFASTNSPTSKQTFLSKLPSTKPTLKPSSKVPVVISSSVPTVKPTSSLQPVTPPSTSACLCNYATGCGPSSPCCAGLTCNVFSGYSQCLEPSGYTTSTNGCLLTASGYGCTSNSNCCNPSAICTNNFCQLTCSVAATPTSPTNAPVAPSTIIPTLPTCLPTSKPSSPSKAPSWSPTRPTITPTLKPSLSPMNIDPLCCSSTQYTDWANCKNAADSSLGTVSSCSTCAAFQCIDWTAGSISMKQRELDFLAATGESVYFGVGSYGNNQARAGLCYRISVASVDRDLIVQVVNQGGDVPDGNFDLQMGDGGFGVFNACTSGNGGSSVPQYDGTSTAWGDTYGGWGAASQCSNLPTYPHCSSQGADSMQDLCAWSFSSGLRLTTGTNSNPTIQKMCEVSCPSQLWQATGLHRSDETSTKYTCAAGNTIPSGGLLTRMMDCAKPSYAWASNVKGTTFSGYNQVIPCRRDGYTRINTMSGSPTTVPVKSPSVPPTNSLPTARPNTIPPTTKSTLPPSKPSTVPTLTPSFITTSSSNPFNKTLSYYVNPSYQIELQSSILTSTGAVKDTLYSMRQVASAYWIDVKSKIYGSNTNSVQGILINAASKPKRQLVTFIVYDLPNRDCNVSS